MTFQEAYDKHSDDEYCKFERVENKLSSRRDIHAFILLNQLVPGHRPIVSASEHDEFWLDVQPEDLDAANPTLEQMLDLIRCGVRYDAETDGLALFS